MLQGLEMQKKKKEKHVTFSAMKFRAWWLVVV